MSIGLLLPTSGLQPPFLAGMVVQKLPRIASHSYRIASHFFHLFGRYFMVNAGVATHAKTLEVDFAQNWPFLDVDFLSQVRFDKTRINNTSLCGYD
jgi:hypothetical protein